MSPQEQAGAEAAPVAAIILAGGRARRLGGIDKPAIEIIGAPAATGHSARQTVLQRLIAAAGTAGCTHVVVVGPPRANLPPGTLQAQEAPEGGGPLAGIGAGLRALAPALRPAQAQAPAAGDTGLVYVLAGDLYSLTAADLARLHACLRAQPTAPGVVAADLAAEDGDERSREDGRADASEGIGEDAAPPGSVTGHYPAQVHYLTALWRTAELTRRLLRLDPEGMGAGLRHLPVRRLFAPESGPPLPRLRLPHAAADLDTPADLGRLRSEPRLARPSLTEARSILRRALAPLPVTTLAVLGTSAAAGAPALPPGAIALAAPVRARAAMPRFTVSAMDGYAYRGEPPWRLLPGEILPGHPPAPLPPGTARRIATGAPVPADAQVVRHERVAVDGQAVRPDPAASTPAAARHNDARALGSEWPAAAEIAGPGTPLDWGLWSTLIAADIPSVQVRGPLAAEVIITGDEISSGPDLPTATIRDLIGPVLPAVLVDCGIPHTRLRRCGDTAAELEAALAGPAGTATGTQEPAHATLTVVIGATGPGPRDTLREVLAANDAQVIVPGIRLRPGGSVVVARLAHGGYLLGLPGNPLAAVLTTRLLLPELVTTLIGAAPPVRQRIPRAQVHGLERQPDRTRADATRADGNPADGTRLVALRLTPTGWVPTPAAGTGHLGALRGAGAVAVLDATDPLGGESIELLPLRGPY